MLFKKLDGDGQTAIDFDRLRKARVARANHVLHKRGIGAAIIYDWDSRGYLSAVWKQPHAKHLPDRFALLIRDAGFPYVHVTRGFDDQRVSEDCPWLEGRILTDNELTQRQLNGMSALGEAAEWWGRCAQQVKSLRQEHGVADLPCSIDHSSPHLMRALQDVGIAVVDGNAWMQEARMAKTGDELILLRLAAACNEAGYAALTARLKPGMRESDALAIMAQAIYEAGAESIEDWIVCSGPRTAPRSFNRSDRVIRPGEMLTIEARHVSYGGCEVCYDRSFLVGGKPTALQKEIYGVAVDRQHKVRETLGPGITLQHAARLEPAALCGPGEKGLGSGTGWRNHAGGVGIGWFEAPDPLMEGLPVTLEENMVLAYHAAYYVPGAEGVAIGNTFRITDTGCENLCQWPFEELAAVGG